MTCEKRMIIDRIDYLCFMLDADDELGGGFTPRNDKMESEVAELQDRLARLQGFADNDDKLRWQERNLPIDVQARLFGWY